MRFRRAWILALLLLPGVFASGQQDGGPFSASLGVRASDAALQDAPQAPAGTAQPNSQPAQQPGVESVTTGSVHGVVVNGDGAVYEGAHIALAQPAATTDLSPPRTTTSDSNGRFDFDSVPAGDFKLTVSSSGFASRVVAGTLQAGQSFEAKPIVLSMKVATTDVEVTTTPAAIAEEELKQEETQRVLGVFPNFYVTYVPNAPPLTSKQKYGLAWRSSIDPVTLLAVGVFAGAEQATNTFSGYGQGAQGYAKRYGAGFADSFISTMIGGAILPAWWKQDPRYFYKGTGTTRSRFLYAVANSVMCKGDNGHWQVNYSGIVGGLAAGGISNLYYPAADRDGAELTFENALIGTGLSAVGNLFQEFVVKKITPHVPNYGANKP